MVSNKLMIILYSLTIKEDSLFVKMKFYNHKHWHHHEALTSSWSIDIIMKHWHDHEALTWSWNIDIIMKHWHHHEALTWSWSIDIIMKHWHHHEALTSSWSIDIIMKHWHHHEALTSSWSIDIIMKPILALRGYLRYVLMRVHCTVVLTRLLLVFAMPFSI